MNVVNAMTSTLKSDYNGKNHVIYIYDNKKNERLGGAQSKRRVCKESMLPYKLLCHLGHMTQQICCCDRLGIPYKAFGDPL